MNCAESRLLLHADADGELDPASGLQLEVHVKTCATCAAEQRGVQSLKAALSQSPLRYEAPLSLRREVRRMARISARGARPGLLQSLLFWKSLATGATAVSVLALLLRPGLDGRDPWLDEAVAGHVRSLMAQHLTDITSSDQHTVKPWFTGKLDFAPAVKDFATQGFPLIGGRLDYLGGRPVAALVYQRNKHFINVFIWPAASTATEKSALAGRRGYSIISRETGGLRYCLVSDLNEKELTELANLLGS